MSKKTNILIAVFGLVAILVILFFSYKIDKLKEIEAIDQPGSEQSPGNFVDFNNRLTFNYPESFGEMVEEVNFKPSTAITHLQAKYNDKTFPYLFYNIYDLESFEKVANDGVYSFNNRWVMRDFVDSKEKFWGSSTFIRDVDGNLYYSSQGYEVDSIGVAVPIKERGMVIEFEILNSGIEPDNSIFEIEVLDEIVDSIILQN